MLLGLRIYFRTFVVIVLSAATLSTYAAQNDAASKVPSSTSSSKRAINFQISSPHSSQTYSCKLMTYSSQCREYEILASATDTLAELSEGCKSMGGAFHKAQCPSKDYLASCVDIVRNYHRPDVIYNNYYYSIKPLSWKLPDVERVCTDLGGELEREF